MHLSIMHLSLRNSNANFDNFVEPLENNSYFFHIICLNETWISTNGFQNNSQYDLPNICRYLLKGEVGKKEGGVVIYTKNNLEYKIRNDLPISYCNAENLTTEIIVENPCSFISCCCYRPQNAGSPIFISRLNLTFEKVNIYIY